MKENSPICAGCGKPFTGSYITALHRAWHEDCFRCAGCQQPLGKERFFEHGDRPYHETCYHDRFSPRCAHCGRPIVGTFTTAQGKTWHPEHFLCAGGREPINGRSFHEHEGKVYCEDHYWQAFGKRCAIGGEILKGAYQINAWGDTYCAEHSAGLAECYSCHRFICERLTRGGVRYDDGHSICNRCRQTAIDTAAQGQPALMQVRRALARLGLEIGPAETPLRLVDQQELNRRSTKSYSKQPTGMACHHTLTRNGQIVERQVEAILILSGLPREHFTAVAAHELMHIYLFVNAFPDLEPVVEEGLCELAEYLWLKQQDTPEAAYRLALMDKNDNPVYGRGFQLARQGLDKMPLLSLLDYVRKWSRFP